MNTRVLALRTAALLAALGLAAPAAAAAEELVTVQQGVDSAPYAFQPSLSRGSRETAYAFRSTDEEGRPHHFRNFVRFDLPQGLLGPDERVLEATASIAYDFDFAFTGEVVDVPGEIRCHEVLEPWQESTLTWSSQPSFGPVLDEESGITDFQPLFCDVTELVRDWLSGARPNHGIVYTNRTERVLGMNTFETQDVGPDFKPSLFITVPEPGAGSAALAALGTLGALARLRGRAGASAAARRRRG